MDRSPNGSAAAEVTRDNETLRLVAWNRELLAAHERLREALHLARKSLAAEPESVRADISLYCKGFCAAPSRHHMKEHASLFPALSARQLDGVAAIMEWHFRYEERQLLDGLAELDLDASPKSGP